jgi:glycosyltransferase involved in cell wall biosynthesis
MDPSAAVLHLISGGDTGGAKSHVLTLLRGLEPHVRVVMGCFLPGEFLDDARSAGIDARLYEQASRFDMRVLAALADACRSEGVRLIHSHGARANFVTALLRRRVRVPAVTTVHSDYRLDFMGNAYKRVLFTALNAWALRRFDAYFAVSQPFRDMLVARGFPGGRIHVIYNGLDFETPSAGAAGPTADTFRNRAAFLAAHGLPDATPGELLVGCLGRLHRVKGQEMLIAAVARLLGQPAWAGRLRLLLAGDGEERAALAQRTISLGIQDRVHLLGHIDDGPDFLAALDVHVLASLSESFPYALLEAARAGTPCVATRVGGIPELIRHEQTGLLVAPGDISGLADAIGALCGDAAMRARLGRALHDHAAANFSVRRMVTAHLDVYREIMDSRTGGR